jgi:hypothetical protein
LERLGFGRDLTTPDSISDCTKLQPIILSYGGGGHGSNRAGAASAHARRGFMRTKVGPGIRLPLRLDLGASLRSVRVFFYAENRVFRIFGGSSRIISFIRPFLLGMLGKGRGRSDVNKRHRDRLSLTPPALRARPMNFRV